MTQHFKKQNRQTQRQTTKRKTNRTSNENHIKIPRLL